MGQRTESDVLRECSIMLSSSHNVVVCVNVYADERKVMKCLLLLCIFVERGSE